MKSVFLILLGAWIGCVSFHTQAAAPFNDNMPTTYTVKKGDTLWRIATQLLSQPELWSEIWHLNPHIPNPRLIYPGDIITFVHIEGKPRLTLKRSRTIKLSPKMSVSTNREAIAPLPLAAINSFLSRNRVVQPGELNAAPYIIAGHDQHLLTGAGDLFYARGDFSEPKNSYGVYRDGGLFVDPISQEVLGIRAQDIGSAHLKALNKDIATLGTSRSIEELRINDRLLPMEERAINAVFYPSSPPDGTRGMIISVEGSVNAGGLLDVVGINLGQRDDVNVGNIFTIYQAETLIKDAVKGGTVMLPLEKTGLLMIFHTYDKMSFGLILGADRAISIQDVVLTP